MIRGCLTCGNTYDFIHFAKVTNSLHSLLGVFDSLSSHTVRNPLNRICRLEVFISPLSNEVPWKELFVYFYSQL
jgi:hypothetical protein